MKRRKRQGGAQRGLSNNQYCLDQRRKERQRDRDRAQQIEHITQRTEAGEAPSRGRHEDLKQTCMIWLSWAVKSDFLRLFSTIVSTGNISSIANVSYMRLIKIKLYPPRSKILEPCQNQSCSLAFFVSRKENKINTYILKHTGILPTFLILSTSQRQT